MSVPQDVERAALAGLLHDIGKFWQRTGEPEPFQDEHLQLFCPFRQDFGNWIHRHAAWAWRFVLDSTGDENLGRTAAGHHLDRSAPEQMLIKLADWLASGERITAPEVERFQPDEAGLQTVFSRIPSPDDGFPPTQYWPLAEDDDFSPESFFPVGLPTADASAYAALWQRFRNDVDRLRQSGHPIPLDTWYCLLRKYTARIPAATPWQAGDRRFVPDISLFDHSRAVAAIAAGLAAQDLSEPAISALLSLFQEKPEAHPQPVLSLVGGDLSGIQAFLYTLSTDKASRILKGRSFFLKLLSDCLARYVADSLGVPPTSILLSSGGHFFLVVPAGADVRTVAQKVNEIMLKSFQGNLLVAISSVDLKLADFKGAGIAKAWRQLSQTLSSEKQRRLSYPARKDFSRIFDPLDEPGDEGECRICRLPSGATDDQDECPLCKSLRDLGSQLRRTSVLLYLKPPSQELSGYQRLLAELGFHIRVLTPQDTQIPDASDILRVVQFNRFDLQELAKERWLGFQRLSADSALTSDLFGQATPESAEPEEEGGPESPRVKTFKEMAEATGCDQKLGFLRADVDNLGRVFGSAFGKEASLSRVATLSRLLCTFFEGWLSHRLNEAPYRDKVYLIYSGGDDLFVVGAWNLVTDLAVELQDAFQRFTGNHPDFTISSGILVAPDHYPLAHAAEQSGQALERAKGYTRSDCATKTYVKSAFDLFGFTVGWEELLDFAKVKDMIVEGIKEQGMPDSFLRKLQSISELFQWEKELLRREGVPADRIVEAARWRKWRWRLVYTLRDVATSERQKEIVAQVIRLLETHEFGRSRPLIDRLGLPLRWAESLVRSL